MCKSSLPGPGIQARCTSLAQMPVFQFCSAECRIFSKLLPFCLFRIFDDDGPPDVSSLLFCTAWPFWQLVAQNSALVLEEYKPSNLELINRRLPTSARNNRREDRSSLGHAPTIGDVSLICFYTHHCCSDLIFQATTDLFFIFYNCMFCVSFCILCTFLMCL